MQKVKLDKVTATAEREFEAYQSGNQIGREMLDSNPSGNGDIGSILRILPNVQFDNAQNRSTTPGEIDPAKISISGGLHYQNNFQLDGVGMNNNLDPAGTGSWIGNAPGRSQGLAVDTSLLESVTVLDSNVGASYGGFTGGVVEANTRHPTKKYGANVSYQFTQGNADPKAFSLTHYHLYGDADMSAFLSSYSDTNQPNFTKHLIRASAESKVNDKFGLITSFSSTLSFIPIRRSDDSYASSSGNSQATPIDPKDSSSAKQEQKRQIYNYFIKAYYDPSENVRLELSYTYAPQYDYRFIVGTVNDFYSFDSGGHNVALKTSWENALGSLTNTTSYQFLENSVDTNFGATKYWQASSSRAWSNWATWVRSGGYAPSESTQHTLSNKIIQDFHPFEVGISTHALQAGLELGYQYADFYFSKPYDSAVKTSTYMTAAQKAACLAKDPSGQWCDTAEAYDTRGFESYDYTKDSSNFEIRDFNGKKMLVWKNGQYFNNITRFRDNEPIKLHNGILGFWLQDSINIPLPKAGALNTRIGTRFDYDTYMGQFTIAPRLSLNYEAPWNEWHRGEDYPTQITAGANRYYGQNLYAYYLADGRNALRVNLYRDSPDKSWEEIESQGRICTPYSRRERKTFTDPLTGENTTKWIYYHIENGVEVEGEDTNCISPTANSTKFQRLRVPFVDELMVGVAQGIKSWSISAKYIYRTGKDDIRYVRSDYVGLAPDSNYANTYYTYSNEGKSWSHIITLLIENRAPIKAFGIQHFFMFAYDWTDVKRNFNDYASSATQGQIDDELIVWRGELIHWSQRPATNFLRPYTLRLNTTHSFNIGKCKWLLNNFLRYRASYDAMALISQAGGTPSATGAAKDQYKPEYKDYAQYGAQTLSGAFTWDLRLGFEVRAYKANTLYMNVDIYNVLDSKNPTIATANYTGGSYRPTIAYEVGRQFWVQVGYKF